jgi:hypothetical protein
MPMGFNTDTEDATSETAAETERTGGKAPSGRFWSLGAFVVDVPDRAHVDLNDFVVAVGPENDAHPPWIGGREKHVHWAPTTYGCADEYPNYSEHREPLGRESKAIIGGREHCIGGWCRYELDRREGGWRYSGRRPASNYPGRSYIGAADVVESVGGAGRGTVALRRAAEAVALSLGRLEDALCDPTGDGLWECLPPSALSANPARRRDAKAAALLATPRVTSADAEDFSKTGLQDPEAIAGIVEDVESVTASLGPRESDSGAVPPPLPPLFDRTDGTGAAFALDWRPPPLASRFVEVGDDEGVLRLEATTAPYLDALEDLQAAAASRLGQAAKTIGDALDARLRAARRF